MSVLVMSEWKSTSGKSYVNFPSILLSERASLAAQDIMGMSTIDFLIYIVEKFNAEITLYKNGDGSIKWYGYSFHSEADCHRHVLEINRLARQKRILESNYISKASGV